jgi:PQQ-dependent dehydrogenase (methanol/ethanol family)
MTRLLTAVATVTFLLIGLWTRPIESQSPSRAVDDAALREANPEEWLGYGRDDSETHYSPLSQVATANVSGLRQAWTADLGTPTGGLETTPLVSDGVMYLTGPWSTVVALDARTGAVKWRWDPQLPRKGGARLCCGPVNRGVALYDGKVYVGLLDMRLVALDAATGEPVWETQTSIDLADAYSITGAPRVVKGKVIIGNGGAEHAVRGYISAYDARTGELAWRFFTVPGDPSKPFEHAELEMAAKTWSGEWWRVGGGGTAWDGMAYDPEADLLYVGTGNGSPWARDIRSPGGGDNLFLASILAIRPDTGRLVWHFQQVPGEQWDYTATQPMILADLLIAGRERKVLMQAPKHGYFYVIDRLTGEFISGEPFAIVTWSRGLDPKTGRPLEAPNARYGTEPVTLAPAPPGAHNWHPMSYHPEAGLVYFPVRLNSYEYARDPNFAYTKGGANLGLGRGRFGVPAEAAGRPAAFFVAWDPVSQRARWQVDITGGGGSGTLATAGGLVFFSAVGGELGAYDARTGGKLWQGDIAPGAATPITYLLDGRQYVAIAAGREGRVHTFALDTVTGAAATR